MSRRVIGNRDRKVFVGGVDVTDRVTDLPVLPRSKPEWGQIPSLPTLNIQVRNDDFGFSSLSRNSLIYARRIDEIPLYTEQAGQRTWQGFLQDAPSDLQSKRATLVGEPALQKHLHRSARLDDPSETTPATAAKRLLQLYGIPVDNPSFARAHAILDDAPCRVRTAPDVLEWQGTMADLLQLYLTAAVGRIYLTDQGRIGFDAYAFDPSPTIAATLTDADMLQWPRPNEEMADPFEGYRVQYRFGFVEIVAGSALQELDFSGSSAVQMSDAASATYTGDTWVRLSQREYIRIELFAPKPVSYALTLGQWIRLDSARIGIDRSAEIIGIDDGDKRWTRLTVRIDKGIE